MPGGSNQLLSVANAAAYLDMPERRLRDNWRRWGIPAYKAGRELRFRVRDLERWIEGNRDAA
jgi:excisionase family DNA binding protein